MVTISCKVMVGEADTIAEFMLRGMMDFNVILGMNWLACYHAILDCHDKLINLEMPKETLPSYFEVNGVKYPSTSYP